MFNIGDYVLHLKTKSIGKVVGYGYELFNNVYTTTLKVLITSDNHPHHLEVVEDTLANWVLYNESHFYSSIAQNSAAT